MHRLYGMAANARQDTGETGADSSNNRSEPEKSGAEKYHPRTILFSGPPQVNTA